MAFKEIAPEDLMLNPFTKIGKEWMLITAGADVEHCNTMTASWGAMGVMWGKNVVSVYIARSDTPRSSSMRRSVSPAHFSARGTNVRR